MYQMTNEIPFTVTGSDGKLKLHEAAAMMMNCCQFQEYQEKAFCNFLRSNDIAIFLYSIQIDILRMPSFREHVRTAVKIYGCKSIYGLRRITMHDENGDLCLISNATGAFFDLKAKKAVKLDPSVFQVEFDEAEPMECLPRKIPFPADGGIKLEDYIVPPSSLDFNGHMTTPMYFAVASDRLPADFKFNRIRIEFKKQSKLNDVIHPVMFMDEDGKKAVIDMRADDGLSYAVVEFSLADL